MTRDYLNRVTYMLEDGTVRHVTADELAQDFADWVRCPHCGRLMHPKALTCGNYCEWDTVRRRIVGYRVLD
jgi:uncharacterized OB-fold protein